MEDMLNLEPFQMAWLNDVALMLWQGNLAVVGN